MKTTFAGVALLTLALATPTFSNPSVQIGLSIGNAPPPPVVVYRRSPRWVMVPHQSVYVVNDDNLGYDYFRYGGLFYIYNSGYWYRSRSYRGPFVAIEQRSVPAPFWSLRERDDYRWRHRPEAAPPGWSHGKAKWKGNDDDHGDHGKGHGNH